MNSYEDPALSHECDREAEMEAIKADRINWRKIARETQARLAEAERDAARYRWLRVRINWRDKRVTDDSGGLQTRWREWTHDDYRESPPDSEHVDEYIDGQLRTADSADAVQARLAEAERLLRATVDGYPIGATNDGGVFVNGGLTGEILVYFALYDEPLRASDSASPAPDPTCAKCGATVKVLSVESSGWINMEPHQCSAKSTG